jgi:histidine phosphotransfer protein HptB
MSRDLPLLYSSLADDPYLGEIIDQFVDAMSDRVDELRARLAAEDWESLRRAAHQLKGSAGSYGFGAVGEAAAILEDAIGHAEPEERITQTAQELIAMCGCVRTGKPKQ